MEPEYKEGRPAHIAEEYAEARFPGPWELVQRMGPVESLPLGNRRGQQRAAEWLGDNVNFEGPRMQKTEAGLEHFPMMVTGAPAGLVKG